MNINYSAGIFFVFFFFVFVRPFLIEIQAVSMRSFYDSCLFALLFASFVRFVPSPNCIHDENLHKGPQQKLVVVTISSNPTRVQWKLQFSHSHICACISICSLWVRIWPSNCSCSSIWPCPVQLAHYDSVNLDEPWAFLFFFGNRFRTCNIIRFINISEVQQSKRVSCN